MTTQELNVPTELVFASRVVWRPPPQVRRSLTNGEVKTFDERRVQGLGILGLQQRVLQARCRADLQAPLDSDDTIVPPSLDHLTIDARGTNEARDHPGVVFEAIRGDQWESDESPP